MDQQDALLLRDAVSTATRDTAEISARRFSSDTLSLLWRLTTGALHGCWSFAGASVS